MLYLTKPAIRAMGGDQSYGDSLKLAEECWQTPIGAKIYESKSHEFPHGHADLALACKMRLKSQSAKQTRVTRRIGMHFVQKRSL